MKSEPRDARPLLGRRILVTRGEGQAGDLSSELRALGATVREIPTVEIAAPDDTSALDRAVRRLADGDWVAFTSANAVRALRNRGPVAGGIRIASVGRSTSEAVRSSFGRAPDLEPDSEFRAEGLANAFTRFDLAGVRVLLPVSDLASDELARRLRGQGAVVDLAVAYLTRVPAGLVAHLAMVLPQTDLVTFASPSAVANFMQASVDAVRVPAVAIGPTTAREILRRGLRLAGTAQDPSVRGLAGAVVRAFKTLDLPP